MVDTLTAQTAQEEDRRAFVQSALVAREDVARCGLVHQAADVHKWLLARAAGRKTKFPRPKELAK